VSELDRQPPDILVVDDTPENLLILMGMLGTHGYRTRPVSSGAMALQTAKAVPPDLILLDIQMPGMDGYEVCRALKEDPALAHIPVIFLSAFTDPGQKVQAFDAGGVDYVTKPFSIREVMARVRAQLRLQEGERELRNNLQKVCELESLRDSLVHMLVHDLRSPLTGIVFYLQCLKEDLDGPEDLNKAEAVGSLEGALHASQRMVQMLNAVLDVHQLEAGQMKLHLVECDLSKVAREAITSQQALAADRSMTLEDAGPALAWADPELLSRVLQNLLSNALKYTPRGGVVEVCTVSEGDWVQVWIRDKGQGVPLELQERIFQKFGQVGLPGRKGFYSTGLGLPFCKLAIEAQGGSIGVESEPGQGANFWFRLPKMAPDRVPQKAPLPSQSTARLATPSPAI